MSVICLEKWHLALLDGDKCEKHIHEKAPVNRHSKKTVSYGRASLQFKNIDLFRTRRILQFIRGDAKCYFWFTNNRLMGPHSNVKVEYLQQMHGDRRTYIIIILYHLK